MHGNTNVKFTTDTNSTGDYERSLHLTGRDGENRNFCTISKLKFDVQSLHQPSYSGC